MSFLGRPGARGRINKTVFKTGHVAQRKETIAVEQHDQTVSAVTDKLDGYNTQIAVVEQEIASLAVAATLDEPEAVARVTELGEQLKSLYRHRDLAATALTAAERAELDRRTRKAEQDDAAAKRAFAQHAAKYQKHAERCFDLVAELQAEFEAACKPLASAFAMVNPRDRGTLGHIMNEDNLRSWIMAEAARAGDGQPFAFVNRTTPTRLLELEANGVNGAAVPAGELLRQEVESIKSSFSPTSNPKTSGQPPAGRQPGSVVSRFAEGSQLSNERRLEPDANVKAPSPVVNFTEGETIRLRSNGSRAVVMSPDEPQLVSPPPVPQRPAISAAREAELEALASQSTF